MNARLVFMGSPEFAVPALNALAARYEVVGVVTQPDRPAGRGRTLNPPPIKTLALELGLPVIQPQRLREAAAMQQLQVWRPDVIVVSAFGQILRPEVLDLPAYGCINVHASLLPRWRGAAPIQAAILNGDTLTGVTIMLMDQGLDTGPLLNQRSLSIRPDDTGGSMGARLSVAGAELLIETLPGFLAGDIEPLPQDESQATYASMLKKEEGRLDLTRPAEELARMVRAFNPWPGTFLSWKDQLFKIHAADSLDPNQLENAQTPGAARASFQSLPAPGSRLIYQGLPALATGHGMLLLKEVQPAGKKIQSGRDFLHGARDWV